MISFFIHRNQILNWLKESWRIVYFRLIHYAYGWNTARSTFDKKIVGKSKEYSFVYLEAYKELAVCILVFVRSGVIAKYISERPIKYCKLLFSIVLVSGVFLDKDHFVKKENNLENIWKNAIGICESLCTNNYQHCVTCRVKYGFGVILLIQPDNS